MYAFDIIEDIQRGINMLIKSPYFRSMFLYGTNEKFHYTYRIMVNLKSEIVGEALRRAADKTMKRYPYFAIKVVKNGDDYEIVPNENPIIVTQGKELLYLGTEETNYHYLTIGYEDKCIFFDVYHMLTDGGSMCPFIKTLLYYYLCDVTGLELASDGIRTLDTEIAETEYRDPFETDWVYPERVFYEYKPIEAFSMGSENKETLGQQTSFFIKVNVDDFMKYIKANDGTPNAIASALFYRAILKNHPDLELPVVAGVAMNNMAVLNAPDSYFSFVSLLHLKYMPEIKHEDMRTLGTVGRGMIMLQSQPENILMQTAQKKGLVNYLETFPTHEQRRDAMWEVMQKAWYVDTYNVSYFGRIDWGSLGEYVESMFGMIEAGEGGAMIEIASVEGEFNISITQSFRDDRYVRSFMELLKEAGVRCSYEGSMELMRPKVKVL